MGFNIPVTAPQQAIIDAGGYTGRDYLCICPLDIIFQARPAADSAEDVIFSIDYDTVTVGVFGNIKPDMVFMVTSGTTINDYKRPLYRGRISKLASSTELFIGEASIALDTALYLTVFDMYEVVQRLRSVNDIDGHLAPETLAPAITGLQSSYFKEPDVITTEASFALSPVGQPMEEGATINDATAWVWDIPGAVYTGGTSAADREIEFDLPTGHVWATVYCEDSNGVTALFNFEIYVQDRYDSDMIYLGNEGADITNNWNEGVNASVNYFAGVEDVLDRWRVTIVTFEKGRGGDAEFPNISFVGYFRQDDSQTTGDETYSILKSRSYQISGFAALAGEVKLSQLAVNDTATPTLWDDVEKPNAARVIAHLTNRYSTLARLVCIDYGTLNDNDWYGGDMDIESPYLLDACNETAEEINAQLVFSADGQVVLRRNLNFQSTAERNAADVIATIPTSRMLVVGYTHPHMPNLAQLQVGFRSYRTADGSSIGLTATAPAVALAEGADFDEAPNQLLTANATIEDARIEAGERAANLLAYRDDSDEFTLELDGAYRFAQPSQHQWWELDITATVLLNAIPESSNRFLLKSISHKFSPERGTRQLRGTFKRETVGGLAMILVEVIPDAVPTVMQPRPPMSAYQGAFNPSGTLNTTSSTPDPAHTPPSGYAYVSMPYSPQQQAEAQAQHPGLNCRVQNPPVNFRNPADVNTTFTLVNGEFYDLYITGSARIEATATTTDDMTGSLGANTHEVSATFPFALWNGSTQSNDGQIGGAWQATGGRTGGGSILSADVGGSPPGAPIEEAVAVIDLVTDQTVTAASFWLIHLVHPGASDEVIGFWDASKVLIAQHVVSLGNTPTYTQRTWTGSEAGVRYVSFHGVVNNGGSLTIDDLSLNGGNANLRGDAFYQWTVDEDSEDGEAELYPPTRGLRLNSTAVAVPPVYSPNHEYHVQYEGEGNPLPLRFEDDNYLDNENALLRIAICGVGAGT